MGIVKPVTHSVLESAAGQSEMEVVLRRKNDVCVVVKGVFPVNFKLLYFMWPNKEL